MYRFSLAVGTVAAFAVSGSAYGVSVGIETSDGSQEVGGTTQTLEGNLAGFGRADQRWGILPGQTTYAFDTDLGGVTGGGTDTASVDWYFNYGSGRFEALDAPLDVATYRYVEIFYSIAGKDFITEDTQNNSRFFIKTTDQNDGSGGINPDDFLAAPLTQGDHRLIVDVANLDGADPSGRTGDYTFFRWDFGNIAGNDGIEFTLDKIVFGSELVPVTAGIPGDADGDGDIDDTDLGISISNFTGPVGAAGGKTAADGDTDGDGDVDDTDLGVSISGFTGPLAAAVPEPTSLALLGLGGLLIARRRRA